MFSVFLVSPLSAFGNEAKDAGVEDGRGVLKDKSSEDPLALVKLAVLKKCEGRNWFQSLAVEVVSVVPKTCSKSAWKVLFSDGSCPIRRSSSIDKEPLVDSPVIRGGFPKSSDASSSNRASDSHSSLQLGKSRPRRSAVESFSSALGCEMLDFLLLVLFVRSLTVGPCPSLAALPVPPLDWSNAFDLSSSWNSLSKKNSLQKRTGKLTSHERHFIHN